MLTGPGKLLPTTARTHNYASTGGHSSSDVFVVASCEFSLFGASFFRKDDGQTRFWVPRFKFGPSWDPHGHTQWDTGPWAPRLGSSRWPWGEGWSRGNCPLERSARSVLLTGCRSEWNRELAVPVELPTLLPAAVPSPVPCGSGTVWEWGSGLRVWRGQQGPEPEGQVTF